MKNNLIAIIVLLGLLLANPFSVSARTSTGLVVDKQNNANEAVVTFAELGFRETNLVSPFDSTRVLFSIPPNWRLIPGGEVQLDYEVTLTGADAGKIGTEQNPYGGSLSVTFNDQLVGNIPLKELGSHTMRFQLPPTALTSVRRDGRHQLIITLSAQFSCIYDIRAIVAIKPTSTFKLPFEVSSPELDLSRLPGPFYLRNSLLPDRTLLVVPDNPDVEGLQAALNVMAGFGSMVGDDFDFGLATAGELTEDDLASSNLIFVGRPDEIDLLGGIEFPLAVENKQFVNLPAESATDGVVEMAISPWNGDKVVLLVSGNSAEGVTKAAQAVSSGRILVYENPALAYVADVQLLSETLPVIEDFTLQNLGYTTETLSGVGENSVQYLFNVSKEQLDAKDATIDLLYYHSGLLNYGFSSFTVELNNQVIASTPFSKESEQLTTLQLKIPPGLLRFGENRLAVIARMLAETSCDVSGFSDPWLTISDQSKFHLPASADTDVNAPWLLDLKFYPTLFLTHSDLGDVAFVLPRSSPANWKIAGQVAYSLGKAAIPLISNLESVYADDVPQKVRDENSLIIIGKSSTLPFLSEINDQLPAPFDFTDDTASERQMQIIYRIPEGVSVGYLELLNSPYNTEKPILVVAGNSDEGLIKAGDALRQTEIDNQLAGVFAVTNGTQIATGKTSSLSSIVGTLVPADQAIVTTPIPSPIPSSSRNPNAFVPPAWLLPLLAVSGIAILLIIGFVGTSALSKKRATTPSGISTDNKLNNGSHANSEDNEKRRS